VRHIFVMDPVESLSLAGDSTYVCMLEASARGHAVGWCTPADLWVQDGVATARVTWGAVRREAPAFIVAEVRAEPLSVADVIWMRKDPPFHMGYLLSTYILAMVPPPTLVVNAPAGLATFNEKLWAMHFADLQPPTLLSLDGARIRAFIEAQPDGAVLKPWDGNGGRGVVVTRRGDPNLPSLVELMTEGGRTMCIAQAYLPRVSEGDKRILLFEGEPVAGVLRVPSEGDHRANLHVGGKAVATALTPREQQICERLRPHLIAHGQIFVGIDVIGGYLTEINVTSPTGLQDATRLYGVRLEADLLDRLERRVAVTRA